MTAPLAPGAPIAPAAWIPRLLKKHGAGWRNWLGPLISLAMLGVAAVQMRSLDMAHVWSLLPSAPMFWIAFVASYLVLPASEWLIYRRLWNVPTAAMLPLVRKRISNEMLLGYSGEVYFYAWARRHAGLVTAPFGAIKDVAILSAQAGNVTTLLLIALAWPLLGAFHLGLHARELFLSGLGIVLLSIPPLLFRRHMLSLPAGELWRIAAVHGARIIVLLALTALLWHEALPAVALSWWLILSALRQLISRLPFVPNKDIMFAGVTAYLIGPHDDLVAMIALCTTLVLVVHVVLGALLAVADLASPSQP